MIRGDFWTMPNGYTVAIAHEPDLVVYSQRLIALYLETFPDGVARQGWKGLTYFRVRPTWLRYSDFRTTPPTVIELTADDLRALG